MSPESVSTAPEKWECPNEYCRAEIEKRETAEIQVHLLEEIFDSLDSIRKYGINRGSDG